MKVFIHHKYCFIILNGSFFIEAPEFDLDALLEDLCSMENEIKDNTVMQDKDVSPNELVTDEGRSSVLSMMVRYLFNKFINFNNASRVNFFDNIDI